MKQFMLAVFVVSTAFSYSQNTSPYWSLNGNNNATLSHKVGTTNNVSLRFVTNNIERMKIHSTGGVGIGISTTPSARLHVAGNAVFTDQVGIGTTFPNFALHVINPGLRTGIHITNTFRGNSHLVGISASSVNNPGYGYGLLARGGLYGVFGTSPGDNYTGRVIGVYGSATGNAGVGERMGIYGIAAGGSRAYGVWGDGYQGATFNAAGFFNGAIYATVYRTTSDRKFKQDITPLSNSMEKLMQINAAAYRYKEAEYKQIHFPTGTQIGFMADEIEQVFPELVDDAFFPATYDEDNNQVTAEVAYKSVNYQGLIPVLVTALQEQQAEIELLKEIIRKLDANSPLSSKGWIKQNTPNPVRNSTTIEYFIPEGVGTARILITNAKGQQLKVYTVSGAGTVNFQGDTLPSGTYHYSLVIDGKTVGAKKLILVR